MITEETMLDRKITNAIDKSKEPDVRTALSEAREEIEALRLRLENPRTIMILRTRFIELLENEEKYFRLVAREKSAQPAKVAISDSPSMRVPEGLRESAL